MSNAQVAVSQNVDARRKAAPRRTGWLLALIASTALVAVPAMAAPVDQIEELAGGSGGNGGTITGYTSGSGGAAGITIGLSGANTSSSTGGGGGGSGLSVGGTGGTGGQSGHFITASFGGNGGTGGKHGGQGTDLLINSVSSATSGTAASGGSGMFGAWSGGGGGGGGFGYVVVNSGDLKTLTINLTGASGGAGGAGNTTGGTGGTGGGGLYIKSGAGTMATIAGSAVVTGGTGGVGGFSSVTNGTGGTGGSGIFATNSGGITSLTLQSGAMVSGGAGGAKGSNPSGAGRPGAGGIGIGGSNLTLTLAPTATVKGGLDGDGTTRGNAIQFTGGTNVLELQGNGTNYATLTGNVVGATASGSSNTLTFTGTGGTFDLSTLDAGGSSAQFQNFDKVMVNNTGTWIMSGSQAGTADAAWTVQGGTLQLGSASANGQIIGSVTVASGASLITSTSGSQLAVVKGTGGITIQDGGHLVLSGVAGAAPLSTARGALTLSSNSQLDLTLAAPSTTALITLGSPFVSGSGNLVLNGKLNITDGGGLAEGQYTLISYAGTKSGSSLTIGTAPTDFEYSFSDGTAPAQPFGTLNTLILTVAGSGLYWNGTAVSGGLVGGDGTWKADTTTNWTNSGGTANRTWTQGKAAIFSGSAGTVTVDNSGSGGAVTAKGLKFLTSGYTIGGGTLTLANASAAPKVHVDGATTLATIAAPLAGSNGLEKVGAGTLVLTGANTYTGGTTVTAGTLQIGTGGSVAGDIVNAAALIFDRSDAASYAGVISGAGTVTKQGAGTLTLTGASTYTGGTTITAGTLQVGDGGTTGEIPGTITNNAALAFDRSDAVTSAGTISGSGSLEKKGAGTLTLTGTNTYTGTTTISAGTLVLADQTTQQVLPAAGGIVNNATLVIDRSAVSGVYAGVISGSGGLVKQGSNVVFLTGTNTYTGGTTITGGQLVVGGATPGNTGAITGDVALQNGGVLSFNRTGTVTFAGAITGNGSLGMGGGLTLTLTGTNTYTGITALQSSTLVVGDGASAGSITANVATDFQSANPGHLIFDRADAVAYAGVISGSGLLEKKGAGTLTLTGASTLTGGTTITAGTLQIGDGGTAGSLAGNITNNAALAFDRSDALTHSGVISGSGSLEKKGAGTLTLTGTNTYTGATTVSAGTLVATTASALGTTAAGTTVANGATLRLYNPSPVIPLTVDAEPLILAGAGVAGNGALRFGSLGADANITFNGPITLAADTRIASDPSPYSPSMVLLGGAITGVGTTLTISASRSTMTLDGTVSLGGGGLIKEGAGALTLSQANSFTGGTTVKAGRLTITNGGALGSGPVTVENGSELTLINVTVGALPLTLSGVGGGNGVLASFASNSFAGAITLADDSTIWAFRSNLTLSGGIGGAGKTLTIFNDNSSVTISGAIATGSGGLVQTGSGITVLTGTNTYTGGTTLLGGTLQIGDGGTSGSIQGNVVNNAALAFQRSDAVTFGGVISGSGSLEQRGTGTLTLTGANTYTGGTTVSAGTLVIGNGATSGSIVSDIINDAAVVFDRSDDIAYLGGINGSGTLEKRGTGTLTLSSISALSGISTVSAGTLRLSGGLLGGDVVVKAGAAIEGDPAVSAGTVGGLLTLEGGASLRAVSGTTTLNVNGLTMSPGSIMAATLGAPSSVAAISVNGALSLDGTLNLTAGTGVSTGTYRLIDYTGAFSGSGLTLGSTPAHNLFAVDTGTGNQVNLIVAAGQWWNGTTTGAGGSAVVGGAGTWNVAGAPTNWTNQAGSAANAWTQASLAIFAGQAGTVTVAGSTAPQVAGIEFLTTGYTVTDGVIALASFHGNSVSRVLVQDDAVLGGGIATVASVLSGGQQLEKTGSGTLVLGGANTYTGGTTITAGTLQIGNGGTSGAIIGDVATSGVLAFNRSDAVAFGGVISGTGAFVQAGAGTLTLTGTNTYTGGTTITAGTLQIGNGGTAGAIQGAVANSGTLVFDRADDIAAPGAITGTGVLVKRGAGTLALTGINSAAAGTTVAAGTLALASGVQLAGDVTVQAGATLAGLSSGIGPVIAGAVTVQDGATLHSAPSVNAGVYGLTVDRLGLAPGATLAVTLGGNTGNAAIRTGTLSLGGTLDVTDAGGMALGVYRLIDYATLASDNGLRLGTTPLAHAYQIQRLPGQVNLAVLDGDILYWNGTTTAADGTVHGGSGTWSNAPGQTNWTTTPANQARAWNGTFAVFGGAAGTVAIDPATAPVAVTGMQFMVDGYTVTGGGLTLASPTGRTQIRVGDGTPAGAAMVARVVAPISGLTGLEKTDLGTLILGGTNTYSGGTTISGGTLQVGDGGTAGSIQGDVINNATLAFARSDDLFFAGAISGRGALVQRGTGTLTLSGASSYAGGTTIASGAIRIGNAGALGTGALALQGRGTLQASDTFTDGRAISLTPVSGQGGGGIAVDDTRTMTLSGPVSGTGALSKTGTGTLVLTGTNSYSGATTVAGGLLEIGGGSALSDTARLTVAAGAGLGLINADEIVGSLAGAGQVALNGYCLITGGDGSSSVFSGTISGAGCLTKRGDGTLTLSGTSSQTGSTTVAEGTIQVTTAGALGRGALALQGAGTLQASGTFTDGRAISLTPVAGQGGGTVAVDDAQTLTLTGAIAGLGTLAKTGTGTLVLGGAGSYTGATTVSAGTLIATGGQAIGDTSAVSVASGAQFILRGNETIGSLAGAGAVVLDAASLTLGGTNTSTTFAGSASGTGGLVKTGTGTLTLSGANTYAGDTRVSGGGLSLSGSVAGDLYVENAATLSGTGRVGQTVHVLDGGTLAGGPGAGLTMGGLTLARASTLAVTLGAPSQAGVFTVAGDVTLGGTLAVTPATGFGFGVYRIMTYSGRLTGTGMGVSGLPSGMAGGVQSSIANQVNLFVEDPNNPVAFWNGSSTRPAQTVLGGTGTWSADSRTNWTNASGTTTRRWNSGFAVFQGTPGTVTVDTTAGAVSTAGMQFVESGYVVTGGALTLTGATASIRVGDGTAAGAATVATLATPLTGSAGLEKNDFGTLVLTGANTYAGGTTVNAGTLRVGSDAALGAAAGGVTLNGGTLAASASFASGRAVSLGSLGGTVEVTAGTDTLTLSGALSGAGGLTKAGAGTLLLLGTGSYAGRTTVNAGTLQIGNGGTAGSITGDVVNNANLVFNRSDTYAFQGNITGPGKVSFMGGGRVLFTATDAYTGPVGVTDTVVRLDPGSATTSPFVIDAGGVVGGTATIGGLTINSGGTASPGYSPGTLTVTGPVSFNAGAVYAVDVTPTGEHDLITATGPVTLSSQAAVQVHATPGRYAPTARYSILSTTATLTGRFGAVTSDYAFLDPMLIYDAQNVYLSLSYTGRSFTDLARSRNQVGAATAAQALGAGTRVYDALVQLPEGQVARAFDQLSGEVHSSINTVIQQQSIILREAVGARLRQSGARDSALTAAARAFGPLTQGLDVDPSPTLWAQAYGGFGHRLGDSNAASISNATGGVLAGLDVAVGDGVRAGVVAGVGQSIFDVNARASTGSFTRYDLGAYAGGTFGPFSLRGGVAQSWQDVTALRAVALPGYSASNSVRHTVGALQGFGEIGYDLNLGAVAVQPFANLAYVGIDRQALRENGVGGSALGVTVRGQDVLYSTLGLRAATQVAVAGHVLTPSVTLGWQHAVGDVVPSASLMFPSGTTAFQVSGVPVAREMALVGAGLAYDVSEFSKIQVNYTGQIGARAMQNAFTAQYSLRF